MLPRLSRYRLFFAVVILSCSTLLSVAHADANRKTSKLCLSDSKDWIVGCWEEVTRPEAIWLFSSDGTIKTGYSSDLLSGTPKRMGRWRIGEVLGAYSVQVHFGSFDTRWPTFALKFFGRDKMVWGAAEASRVWRRVDVAGDVTKTGCEKTPDTHPDDFTFVKGTRAKKNIETGEIWEKDLLHKNHWEVYRNKKDYDNGQRDRDVWNDGRIKGCF